MKRPFSVIPVLAVIAAPLSADAVTGDESSYVRLSFDVPEVYAVNAFELYPV
ncbi:MAG: hypothetical protein LBC65_04105 [Oscillospiraceae bacterium]|jgi:hypothetical protein|nr:hypothetical protein [Oscillospiraceae bacterium]